MDLVQELFSLLKQPGTNIATLAMSIISAANLVMHKNGKHFANLSLLTSTPREQVLKQVTSEQESLIHNMVEKTLSHKDPFFSVLSRRMERLVRQALEKTGFLTSTTTKTGKATIDILKKNGLDCIGREFPLLVEKITLLAQHNRDVYGAHYDSILKKYVR